jgi:murein DD-endopeptidase MepM/ murein hydrolase activator NlpD
MMTTTDYEPIRPRGGARHAANTAAAPEAATPGAAEAAGTRLSPRGRHSAEAVSAAQQSVVSTAMTASEVTSETARAAVRNPAVPVSAEHHPASDEVRSTTNAAYPLPTTPTTSSAADALPSRRTLRPAPRPPRPADLGRAVTQAITLPLRTLGTVVASAKTVPITATAVVACLFVSVATPQTATAATPQAILTTLDAQQYTVAGGSSIAVERDAFAIGMVPARNAPAAAPSKAVGSARPVTGSIPVAGGFGSRSIRGCTACSTNHQGLDFAALTGTPVVAAMGGRVVSAGVFGGYGNQILLQHHDGSQTRYGHLSQIGVHVGRTVSAGQRIGAVGNTGVSTGAHLHFEVIIGGTPINPATWLQTRGLLE